MKAPHDTKSQIQMPAKTVFCNLKKPEEFSSPKSDQKGMGPTLNFI